MSDRSRPTLATVAARAAVAPSTASLVFAGSDRVAPATRDRVLAAAADLGYAGPDPVARSLRSRRSGVVGAVIGDRLAHAFSDPVSVQLLDGVTEVLSPLGVGLLLLPGDADRHGPTLAQLAHVPLDAVVYATCGLEDDPALVHLQRRGVPVVAVDGPCVDDVVFVGIPDRRGTAELAGHLADLGHRRVAVVTLPLRLDGTRGLVGAARRAGTHHRTVRERTLGVEDTFGPVPAWETAANAVEEGERAGRQLLDVPAGGRPTAVVAQSDVLAAGVLRAADSLGLRVPEDVSVAGFDGAELPWLPPVRLTTVVQPTTEKGRVVGRAVTDLVAGRRPDDVVLDVHLSVGTTTGPPPPS
ncbi:LacI family DNA-binding transcriptional regulator [Geodermatophilus sp. DSM 45219]|uniref:LacI family DNA-binding transcriptional regulator n=1 Tax=Geodermatophilus sp. DSM 45219 TaxID=1881103 RepID=UPI0008914159|nr:LacI family DNA-binding transcriptional regulator [Geodermatophilus sp. DSM 45219]SDO44148.1 transcriptional regulator, LacI family [Geodermatophilus sp. DSM 45219]